MHFAGVLYCSTKFLIFAVHAHPLEHAVTIGRTRRTVADGTLVDCRTALICTVFLRFISMAVVQVPHFMWFQPYVQAGRGSMLENVFLSTARLRRGVSRSGSVVPDVHNHRLYLPGFSFTRGTILRWERYICRPVSKARTLSCTNRLVREARCMRRSAGVPACSLQVSSCTRFISGRFLRVELACKVVRRGAREPRVRRRHCDGHRGGGRNSPAGGPAVRRLGPEQGRGCGNVGKPRVTPRQRRDDHCRGVHISPAVALRNLSIGKDASRAAVVAAGALPPLVELLSYGSDKGQGQGKRSRGTGKPCVKEQRHRGGRRASRRNPPAGGAAA